MADGRAIEVPTSISGGASDEPIVRMLLRRRSGSHGADPSASSGDDRSRSTRGAGLAHCERCDAGVQGTAVSRRLEARYLYAGRSNSQGCEQPSIRAEVVEQQLVEFLADFKPEATLRDEILRRLANDNGARRSNNAEARNA
jgi:hypothetical protein